MPSGQDGQLTGQTGPDEIRATPQGRRNGSAKAGPPSKVATSKVATSNAFEGVVRAERDTPER